MNKKVLTLDKVHKHYFVPNESKKMAALDSISFDVNQGEIISVIGPSGCGKSTLLNIIAGFEKSSNGNLSYNGQPIQGCSPDRAVVFQSSVLFPWLNIEQNIAYGLKMKKESKESIKERVKEYIKLVRLEGFEKYYPEQISGGMRQRVALARVLIMKPRLLLMDEPFCALDFQSRLEIHKLVLELWGLLGLTIVFITHDIEEALFLSDKVMVMSKRPGKILKQFHVPFEKPRPTSIIGDIEFTRMKKDLLSMLM